MKIPPSTSIRVRLARCAKSSRHFLSGWNRSSRSSTGPWATRQRERNRVSSLAPAICPGRQVNPPVGSFPLRGSGKWVGSCNPCFPHFQGALPALRFAQTIDSVSIRQPSPPPPALRYVGSRKNKISRELDEGRNTPESSGRVRRLPIVSLMSERTNCTPDDRVSGFRGDAPSGGRG